MIDFLLRIKLTVIVLSQIDKWCVEFQHMVDRNEHTVGNSHDSTIFAPAYCQTVKLSLEKGALFCFRSFCALDQCGF